MLNKLSVTLCRATFYVRLHNLHASRATDIGSLPLSPMPRAHRSLVGSDHRVRVYRPLVHLIMLRLLLLPLASFLCQDQEPETDMGAGICYPVVSQIGDY